MKWNPYVFIILAAGLKWFSGLSPQSNYYDFRSACKICEHTLYKRMKNMWEGGIRCVLKGILMYGTGGGDSIHVLCVWEYGGAGNDCWNLWTVGYDLGPMWSGRKERFMERKKSKGLERCMRQVRFETGQSWRMESV